MVGHSRYSLGRNQFGFEDGVSKDYGRMEKIIYVGLTRKKSEVLRKT